MAQTLPIDQISARLQAVSQQDLPADSWTVSDGPRLDLTAFVETMKRVDDGMFPIAVGHIVKVLQAWESCEDHSWDGGYLVELTDGRRADIMIVVEDHDWQKGGKVTVDLRPSAFHYGSRKISCCHCSQVYGFTDQVEAFNDFLATLRDAEPAAG